MELQVKTAAQMRDQGHALKQKAEELVTSAEERVSTRTLFQREGIHYTK